MKLSQIALKYLKSQKKHTIITIIAIIISVAFMTIMLSAVSVYRSGALNAARTVNGTYHVLFNGLSKQQLVDIRSMDIFDETEIYSISSYTSSTDIDFGQMESEDAQAEYLMLYGNLVDDVFLRVKPDELTMLPQSMLTVREGRLPEKDGEIVISDVGAYMWDYPRVGDTVTARIIGCSQKKGAGIECSDIPEAITDAFDVISDKQITFTVVGLSEDYNYVHYSDTQLKAFSARSDNMIARFSDKTNDIYWDLNNAFANMGYEIDDFEYGLNQELMDYEGKGVKAKFSRALFFAVVYLAVIFIMFCVRLVIDNSFEISAKERIKQMGLLKAVGASKRQVLFLTLWEAFFLAVPGVIAGILLGCGISAGIVLAIKNSTVLAAFSGDYDITRMIEYSIEPYVIISSAVIGVLWVCVSAVSTGMRSIRSSPVEAMRSAGKKEKITAGVRASKLERGGSFVSAYSSLSIRRNKKRYIITMVSLVMSITLFSGFSYGIKVQKDRINNEFSEKRAPYDYKADINAFSPYTAVEEALSMISSGSFTDVQYDSNIALFGSAEQLGIAQGTDLYDFGSTLVYIHPVNRETYNKYIVSENGITYDELIAGNGMLISADVTDSQNGKTYKAYSDVPVTVTGKPFVADSMEFLDEITINTPGLYSSDNNLYRAMENSLCAVMPDECFCALVEELGADSNTYTYTAEDGRSYAVFHRSIYANASEGSVDKANGYLNSHFYGSYTDNRRDNSEEDAKLALVKIVGVFAVIIISLIAAVNIVNIISANILNRTSELAMLRACGMSDKQLHKLVFTEGMSYSAAAGIISLILVELSVIIIKLPFILGFEDLDLSDLGMEFTLTGPLPYILIAVIFAFIIAAAASYVPARRIINSPIVDNICSEEQI